MSLSRCRALIAVAHGSRDPRSAATMSALVDEIRRQRPDLDVRLAFLDLTAPSVPEVIARVAADGYRTAVVVPLLLGSAYHARVDLPALLDTARPGLTLTQTDVLGDSALPVLRARLTEAGVDPDDDSRGIALAAVGTSSAQANAATAALATRLAAGTRWHVAPCFATATPSVEMAAATLRAAGARRVVVAPWFLAPGVLTDRIAASGLPMASALGPHPILASAVARRYDTAIGDQTRWAA